MNHLRRLLLFSLFHSVSVLSQSLYLYPSHKSPEALSSTQAELVVAHHLQLDQFVELQTGDEQVLAQYLDPVDDHSFLGDGLQASLLVNVESDDLSWLPSDSFSKSISINGNINTNMVQLFANRASRVFNDIVTTQPFSSSPAPRILDIFTASTSEDVGVFLDELSSLVSFVENHSSDSSPSFGAFEFTSLSSIKKSFGANSEEYQSTTNALMAALQSATATPVRIALLFTPPSQSLRKRTPQPPQSPLPPDSGNTTLPPQEPFFSVSTCFNTFDACTNGTNSCSGHGACTNATRGARTCYVCACRSTLSATGAKQVWVGAACERLDVSVPFALLAGTGIALIVLVLGSIRLLYSIGTQELPGTLMGVAPAGHLKKD